MTLLLKIFSCMIILRSQLANFRQFWSKFCHPWDQCKSDEKRFSLYAGSSGRLFLTACLEQSGTWYSQVLTWVCKEKCKRVRWSTRIAPIMGVLGLDLDLFGLFLGLCAWIWATFGPISGVLGMDLGLFGLFPGFWAWIWAISDLLPGLWAWIRALLGLFWGFWTWIWAISGVVGMELGRITGTSWHWLFW